MECACPVVEPPRTNYSFSDSRELRVELYPPNVPADWDANAARLDTLGFLVYGRWGEQVYLLDDLPYTTPDGRIVIQAIDAQGGVVVTLDGQTGLITVGQHWLESSRTPQATPPGCVTTGWYQLTNEGLLERSQITAVK